MSWVAWALLLLAQNASFTWVSRARNSRSLKYHAVAAMFSNGVWIVSQFVLINKFNQAKHDWLQLTVVCVFYMVLTVVGSVGMHHFLQTRVEKGRV